MSDTDPPHISGGDIPIRPDGLQLDERRRFQDRFWTAQRIIWAVYLGLIAASLAGLTGRGGPLAVQTVSIAEGRVEAPRITRRGATDRVVVDFATAARNHRLLLGRDFLDRFELTSVTPHPMAEAARPDGVLLSVAASGTPPHRVTLHLRARGAGLAETALAVDGVALSLRILTLP